MPVFGPVRADQLDDGEWFEDLDFDVDLEVEQEIKKPKAPSPELQRSIDEIEADWDKLQGLNRIVRRETIPTGTPFIINWRNTTTGTEAQFLAFGGTHQESVNMLAGAPGPVSFKIDASLNQASMINHIEELIKAEEELIQRTQLAMQSDSKKLESSGLLRRLIMAVRKGAAQEKADKFLNTGKLIQAMRGRLRGLHVALKLVESTNLNALIDQAQVNTPAIRQAEIDAVTERKRITDNYPAGIYEAVKAARTGRYELLPGFYLPVVLTDNDLFEPLDLDVADSSTSTQIMDERERRLASR